MGGTLTHNEGDDIQIKGATDQVLIGNVADRLKVDASFSASSSNSQLDAFGRLRVSSPETIFDSSFRWDKQPITWTEQATSGGTATHDPDLASVVLACTTTTDSKMTFQSRQYTRYHPGKSHLIQVTGNFRGADTSVRKRLGYFDDANGVFFELNGSTLQVVRRSSTSGSAVDTATTQSNWNIDKLDGTGASGITLDITKQQIFVIDFQWLGSGRIRYGVMVGGALTYCHEDNNANILTEPWAQTGDAPIRAEIINTDAAAGDMHITCAAVICENFWSPKGLLRTINNGTTARTFGLLGSVLVPVISLRKQSAYVNVPVVFLDAHAFAGSSDDFLISIVYNGTLTGASWTNVSGVCQQDVSATSISGGTTLYSLYLRGSSGSASIAVADIFSRAADGILGRDVAGDSDTVSLVALNLTSTATLYGVINYKELL